MIQCTSIAKVNLQESWGVMYCHTLALKPGINNGFMIIALLESEPVIDPGGVMYCHTLVLKPGISTGFMSLLIKD